MSAVPEDRRPIWEQMDDVSRQIREARDDAAREQLAAAHAMLRTVYVEAQGAPPGWVMMKSWVIRDVEALLASADPGVAPESDELVVSERAYEQIAGERDRPGEAIPALVDLFERSKDDLMSDTVETGPDGLVDRVAKVFTAATFWLIKDDVLVREIAEAFRAGARAAITEVRSHDQPSAGTETAPERSVEELQQIARDMWPEYYGGRDDAVVNMGDPEPELPDFGGFDADPNEGDHEEREDRHGFVYCGWCYDHDPIVQLIGPPRQAWPCPWTHTDTSPYEEIRHEQPGTPVAGPGGRGPDVACWECGSAHAGNVCPPIMDPPPPVSAAAGCKTCGGSRTVEGDVLDARYHYRPPCPDCCGGSTDRPPA